jgi:ATP-binding cassette, subfamily C (CFTR/MRP), member 1
VTTFTVFAIQAFLNGSQSLNTVRAFTSLALISLVAYPASRLLSAAPQVFASLGCFDRIQSYLLLEERSNSQVTMLSSPISDDQADEDEDDLDATERDRLLSNGHSVNALLHESGATEQAIEFDHVSVCLPTGKTILKDLVFSIPAGSFTCVTGHVGVGKTSLIRAILGELNCTTGRALINPSLRGIGYCAQSSWIPHGTMKEIICGIANHKKEKVNNDWYHKVIDACCLRQDIDSFVLGDQTVVGSRGATISGGQKQRITLARALYQRPALFLLDSVFSSLDSRTSRALSENLFGASGLFKTLGATVLITTYDSEYLSDVYYALLKI